MLKNGVKFYGFAQRQLVKTLQQPFPYMNFSNVNSKVSEEQAAPESKAKTSSSTNGSSKTFSAEQELYYPVKPINFNKRNLYPIYTLTGSELPVLPKVYSFLTSYSFFLMYGVTYIFFLDIYNYWHLLPLTLLFLRGGKNFFSNVQMSGTVVKSVFLKKDGNLVVTVPKTPVYYKYQEDIDLSAFGNFEDDIKLTVDLGKVLRIGFLESLRAADKEASRNVENFTEIKSKQAKRIEKQFEEEAEAEKAEVLVDEKSESSNILMVIEKDQKALPLYIDLDKNSNKAYNDYLIAIAQKKKLVLRETKDEA